MSSAPSVAAFFDQLAEPFTAESVFDQLPDIAKQISGAGKANITLQHRSRVHSISIESKDWYAYLEDTLAINRCQMHSNIGFKAYAGIAPCSNQLL